MMPTSPYSHLINKLRLPDPSFQRLAVVSIFELLGSSSPETRGPDSDHGAAALSLCLTSSSPTVADQAVHELCRLVKAHRLDPNRGLLELHSALEGCDSQFLPLFVKGIGFLCRLAFSEDPSAWRRRYSSSPELHPFVKVLSCREEAKDELRRQVLSFIVKCAPSGFDAVSEFLRPFLTFSVLGISSSPQLALFTKNLVSSIAALSCYLKDEALSIIKLLLECLKLLPRTNENDLDYLISYAEYLVDAFIVTLKQFTGTGKIGDDLKACILDFLVTLLSVPIGLGKSCGVSDSVSQLSRRLLVAQKELGLGYLPEFVEVALLSSVLLTQAKFEHSQLSILKLLVYLMEWKFEILQCAPGISCSIQELLLILPVVNLLCSPSRSVKTAASHLISLLEQLILNTMVSPENVQSSFVDVAVGSSLSYVISRFLHYFWFQECPSGSFLNAISLVLSQNAVVSGGQTETASWISKLMQYHTLGAEKLKALPATQFQQNLLSGLSLLLCSICFILVLHPLFGGSAVNALAAVGVSDPKVAMPLLLSVLFLCKVFCQSGCNSIMVLRLLELLPSLASHSHMVPLVVQIASQLLHKDAKPVLRATANRLLCKTWLVNDGCFTKLLGVLAPTSLSSSEPRKDLSVSISASVRDVCKHNPDRGVDLILSVSSCIASRDPSIQSLGLDSLSHLCEADVVDFYTAWDVIRKDLLDYKVQSTVAHSLCKLLRWGAMDIEAYHSDAESIVQILWEIGTARTNHSLLSGKARASAFDSLLHFEVGHVHKSITNFKQKNVEFLISEDSDEVLKALERFEINNINYEHITRRRLLKEKRPITHKVEKLLSLVPQAVFPPGEQSVNDLPGAALLSLDFVSKEFLKKGTSKDLSKLHAIYENKLLELAHSLQLSRNIVFALLALESWQAFMGRWINDASSVSDPKHNMVDGDVNITNDILKILCKVASYSVPRAQENIALAVGALCMVLQRSGHLVASVAAEFLLEWLLQYEHESLQWTSAVSLGHVYSSLHKTDRSNKHAIINGLLKALENSESYLVKGACSVGLGLVSRDFINGIGADDHNSEIGGEKAEVLLMKKIVRSLSLTISTIYPRLCSAFKSVIECIPLQFDKTDTQKSSMSSYDNLEVDAGDIWGMAGLVMGLGNCIVAVYRFGAAEAVLLIKDIIISLIPFVNSSTKIPCFDDVAGISLSVGACIVLPSVIAFCVRNELLQDGLDEILRAYSALIAELVLIKKSGIAHQCLVMASCLGVGSLISSILSDGLQPLKIDDINDALEVMRTVYTDQYPPVMRFGGMLGIVNAFGADVSLILNTFSQQSSPQHSGSRMESSYMYGPILASHALESLSIHIARELFMLAKDPKNRKTQNFASWAVSLLRRRCWSVKFGKADHLQYSSTSTSQPVSQSFAEDSLVWNLYVWLLNLRTSEIELICVNTVAMVLRCLCKAPRLPISSDWGPIIRHCMRLGARDSQLTNKESMLQSCETLREDCIRFSLAHASRVDSLLEFLDDTSELSRFRTLDYKLQVFLLSQIFDLVKVLSGSRQEKLHADLIEYFTSSSSSYSVYGSHKKCLLRTSFWSGLSQSLSEGSNNLIDTSGTEKCMRMLFSLLPMLVLDGGSDLKNEWSVAIQCLAKYKIDWLVDYLQVSTVKNDEGVAMSAENMKRSFAQVRLVLMGIFPLSELGKFKAYLLNAQAEGAWCLLVEVAAAIVHAEGSIRSQWLVDAIDISIVSRYPSTALRFIGILSSCCCKFMPVMMLDPITVLNDLPVSLPSLLTNTRWTISAEILVKKLWTLTMRICDWSSHLRCNDASIGYHGIDRAENTLSVLLVTVMQKTCISLKSYLPFDQQLKLANLYIHDVTVI